MKNVEFSLKSFKLKKLLALATCAVLAMGVMVMPVEAAAGKQTGDPIFPTATADASNPQSVIDAINNNISGYVLVNVPTGVESISSSIFQAAMDKDISLKFELQLEGGRPVYYTFYQIDKAVDMKMGVSISTDAEILKNLKDENAIALDFEHSGDLPGEMIVTTYDENFADVENDNAPLYWLNEATGKLEKQGEDLAYITRGAVLIDITHCSTYVVTDKAVADDKLQVAEPNADTTVVKKTGIATGNKTLALLAIGGAVIYFATRKEEKA